MMTKSFGNSFLTITRSKKEIIYTPVLFYSTVFPPPPIKVQAELKIGLRSHFLESNLEGLRKGSLTITSLISYLVTRGLG